MKLYVFGRTTKLRSSNRPKLLEGRVSRGSAGPSVIHEARRANLVMMVKILSFAQLI
jgi:hypothetical protein